GGTKMHETSAASAFTAWATVSKIGTFSSKRWPPRPGVTPATTLVPYWMHARAWSDPNSPVMPWKTTLVSLLTRMLMASHRSCALDGRHDLLCPLAHRRGGLD